MTFHEAMHSFVAHWLGDDTAERMGRLTLNPLKHVDLYTTILLPVVLIALGQPPIFAAKPVPFNPERVRFAEFGAALVGLAGPLTNLALAVVASMLLHIGGIAVGTGGFTIIVLFMEVNIGFFVFNMIPVPPLDGSRLLYAFAPEPVQEVMARVEAMGLLPVLVIFLFLFQFIAPILGNAENAILTFLLR